MRTHIVGIKVATDDRRFNPDALEQPAHRYHVIGTAEEKHRPIVVGQNTGHPDAFPHLPAEDTKRLPDFRLVTVSVHVLENEPDNIAVRER